jgi:predicted RNase H-like nuclease (RuvC/YqgF family)
MVKGEYEMTDTTKYEGELKAELKTAKDDIDGRDWYIERLKREHSDFKKEGLARISRAEAQAKAKDERIPSLERYASELYDLLRQEKLTTEVLKERLKRGLRDGIY